jgi:dihydropteroate synthase
MPIPAVRLLHDPDRFDVSAVLRRIGVTPQGIAIMMPKAHQRVFLLERISSYAARIIKQEALCEGAELACPKDVIAKNITADCVLIASDAQLDALSLRLKRQSKSLLEIDRLLSEVRLNLAKRSHLFLACGKRIVIDRPFIMGILNVTPDSFSGDGLCGAHDAAFARAEEMLKQGADIIDVGGESTRPFAPKVSAKEEIARVVPLIKAIAKRFPKTPISADTYKPQVAAAALDAGAVIVNDIGGLRDAKMRSLVAKTKAGVCIMHMKGTPRTMQKDPAYDDCLAEVYAFLAAQAVKAAVDGISREAIVFDPGIGFGKRVEDNLALIEGLATFRSLGSPVLMGLSRKSFIGATLGIDDPAQRGLGSELYHLRSLQNGASILRVHDVSAAAQTRAVFGSLSSNRS